MPFNDDVNPEGFEYELMRPARRPFLGRGWPVLYFQHRPAIAIESAEARPFGRWLHRQFGLGNEMLLRLVPELWPGLPATATIRSKRTLVDDHYALTHLEMSPLRPGDPGGQLLFTRFAPHLPGKTHFLLCHFETAYAVVNRLGDVLVTHHATWRDSDAARGMLAGLRLQVGGNHPQVDQALLLMTAFAVMESRQPLDPRVAPAYGDLEDWFAGLTR
jgi:hypothetical protein